MTKEQILNFKFQPGDFILIDGKGFVSDGIEWFEGGKYSHIAVYVGGGIRGIIEAVAHGVQFSTVDVLLKRAESICVRRIPNLTVDASERMKSEAYSMLHKKYDYLQFASLGLYLLLKKVGITWKRLIKNLPNKLICSEVAGRCAAQVPFEMDWSLGELTPQSFYVQQGLETHLEGKVETC